MNKKITVILLLMFLFISSSIFAETIVLKSDKTVEGKIIEKTTNHIKVDISGIPIIYYLTEIESINGEKINLPPTSNVADKQDKNIVNFKLCCADENQNCSKAMLKLPSGKTEEIFVENNPVLTIDDIAFASVTTSTVYKMAGDTKQPKVSKLSNTNSILLKFTDKGREKLKKITSQNINKQMAVFINGNLVMAPYIKEPIAGGELEITGNNTEEQAKSLVDNINKAIEENIKK